MKTKRWPKPLRAVYVKGKRMLRVGMRNRARLARLGNKVQAIAGKAGIVQSPFSKKILKGLTHPQPAKRTMALQHFNTEKALAPVFIELMAEDIDPTVRRLAAYALRLQQCRAAIPKMLERLKHEENISARVELMNALGAMEKEQAEDQIIDFIAKSKDPRANYDAAEALAKMGSQKAVNFFSDFIKDPRNPKFASALQALEKLSEYHKLDLKPAVPSALKALKAEASAPSFEAAFAALILGRAGGQMKRRELFEAMQSVHRSLEKYAETIGEPQPQYYRDTRAKLSRAMGWLARERVNRNRVKAQSLAFKRKLKVAEEMFRGLKGVKTDLLVYALISQPNLWKQVPESLENAPRDKIEFLKSLEKDAVEHSEEEIILILGIGKKGLKI